MLNLKTKLFAAGAVALAVGFGSVPAKAQDFINVLTGGTSGVYYPLGVALAKIYSDNMEGVQTQVQSTKASVENLNLLQQGRGEIALALGDSVMAAWAGDQEAGFPQQLDKIRAIAAIYPNYVQIVASKESGITDLEDLKGRSLSVGAPASGTELNARAIFAAAGMSYDDLGKIEYLPFAESVELIKNRQLDATLQSAGLGVASIRDLASSVDVVVVEVPVSLIEKAGAPFQAGTIPAGTYRGQDEDVQTVASATTIIARADLDEDLVYELTRTLVENRQRLMDVSSALEAFTIEGATVGLGIDLHPGAERYFREIGALE
jgi:uncharacterized protein